MVTPTNKYFNEEIDEIIDIELAGIERLRTQIKTNFNQIISSLYNCSGKIIVTGIGKSGLIGKKIAATLCSTGSISIFLNPVDAIHGDLGVVSHKDIILIISYSGETDELLKLIPSFMKKGNTIISLTGSKDSTLAKNSTYIIDIGIEKEACPLKLAPTTSTTVTLIAGDILAILLMKLKKFKEIDFANFHPGGNLGRKLLCRVKDEMRIENLPQNSYDESLQEVILEISRGMLGLTIILNDQNKVTGIITDGDLRRAMLEIKDDFFQLKASDIMNTNPTTVNPELLIHEAEQLMMTKNINSLIVVNNNLNLIGIITQRNIKYSN